MFNYRLDFIIPIPFAIQAVSPPKLGEVFPEKLGPLSRVPNRHEITLNGKKIIIGPPILTLKESVLQKFPSCDFMQLLTVSNGSNVEEAIINIRQTIELVLDSLSFQTQISLNIYRLEVIKLTSDMKEGDVIEQSSFNNINSFITSKSYSDTSKLGLNLKAKIDLDSVEFYDKRVRVLLLWYIKSLHSPFVFDKIPFLFVILDKLCPAKEKRPFKTNCNHLISNCPKCGISIKKSLQGEAITDFLLSKGFNQEETNDLWRLRQLVHGEDYFFYDRLTEISKLITRLSLVIANELSIILKLPISEINKIDVNTLIEPFSYQVFLRNVLAVELEMNRMLMS